MLGNATIKAFVPTVKPAEAKIFYQEILGFKLLNEDNYALEFDALEHYSGSLSFPN